MSLQKRHFWTFFWTAFNKAFTEKSINSGWTKTGLHPFDPEVVLEQLSKKAKQALSPSKFSSETILLVEPTDTNGIRKLLDDIAPRHRWEGQKMCNTVWVLTGRVMRAEGEIKGMAIALRDKKNQGKGRGKDLMEELRAEGESNFLFLSPKKITRARELKAQREQAKEKEAAVKKERKVQAAIGKEKRKLDGQRKKLWHLEMQLERTAAREEKKRVAQDQRDDAAAVRQLHTELKSNQQSQRQKKKHTRAQENNLLVVGGEERDCARKKTAPKHLENFER